MELQEERVQRLQDLQEIYSKDKQLELLANEMVTTARTRERADKAARTDDFDDCHPRPGNSDDWSERSARRDRTQERRGHGAARVRALQRQAASGAVGSGCFCLLLYFAHVKAARGAHGHSIAVAMRCRKLRRTSSRPIANSRRPRSSSWSASGAHVLKCPQKRDVLLVNLSACPQHDGGEREGSARLDSPLRAGDDGPARIAVPPHAIGQRCGVSASCVQFCSSVA